MSDTQETGTWCCPGCGSPSVQVQSWVDPNNGEIHEDTGGYSWCNNCEHEGRDGELKGLAYVYGDGTVAEYREGGYVRIPFVPTLVAEGEQCNSAH